MMLCKAFFYKANAYMNSLCLFANIIFYIITELIMEDSKTVN